MKELACAGVAAGVCWSPARVSRALKVCERSVKQAGPEVGLCCVATCGNALQGGTAISTYMAHPGWNWASRADLIWSAIETNLLYRFPDDSGEGNLAYRHPQ